MNFHVKSDSHERWVGYYLRHCTKNGTLLLLQKLHPAFCEGVLVLISDYVMPILLQDVLTKIQNPCLFRCEWPPNCQSNWWKQFIQLDHTKSLLLNGSKKLRLVNKHERNKCYYLLSAANLAKVGYRDQDILALIKYIRVHWKMLKSMKELKHINLLAFLKQQEFFECAGALSPS